MCTGGGPSGFELLLTHPRYGNNVIVRQGSPGIVVGICDDAVHLTVKFDEREDGSDLCVNVTWMNPLFGQINWLAAGVSVNAPNFASWGVMVRSSTAPQSQAVALFPACCARKKGSASAARLQKAVRSYRLVLR